MDDSNLNAACTFCARVKKKKKRLQALFYCQMAVRLREDEPEKRKKVEDNNSSLTKSVEGNEVNFRFKFNQRILL